MISNIALEDITDDYLINIHPGSMLRLDYFPELGITEYRFAKLLGVSQTRLSQIFRGERSVTANMALRLGKLFGQSPEMWIRLQADYDLLKARRQMGDKLDLIQTFPIESMAA
jgi:addiction module HigA family antidote